MWNVLECDRIYSCWRICGRKIQESSSFGSFILKIVFWLKKCIYVQSADICRRSRLQVHTMLMNVSDEASLERFFHWNSRFLIRRTWLHGAERTSSLVSLESTEKFDTWGNLHLGRFAGFEKKCPSAVSWYPPPTEYASLCRATEYLQ